MGDSSFSGGVQVITSGENSEKERKRIDLFTYKLVGIIQSEEKSFISLRNLTLLCQKITGNKK